MHLRVSDPAADFALGEAVHETHAEYLAFERRELGPAARERLSVFGKFEPVILAPQHVRQRRALFVVLGGGGVERRQLVVLAGIDRLDRLLDRALERVGELVERLGSARDSVDSRSA